MCKSAAPGVGGSERPSLCRGYSPESKTTGAYSRALKKLVLILQSTSPFCILWFLSFDNGFIL